MKKKKSFIHDILIYLLILTFFLVIIFGAFLLSSYTILKNEIKNSSNAFLTIYSNEFSNKITEMDNTIKKITTQGEDIAKIKSSDENTRSLAAISLSNYLQDLIIGNDVADIIVVYDNNYDICLDAVKQGFNFKLKNQLRDYTQKAVGNPEVHSYEWNLLKLNNDIYIYKMLLTGERAIAIYIRTSRLLGSLATQGKENRTIALVDRDGLIGRIWGSQMKDIVVGTGIDQINQENYYIVKNPVVEDQLYIYCFTRKNSVLQQTHSSMIVVAISVCLAMLFLMFILRYTRKEITYPMQLMVEDMERIKGGEFENRVDGDFKTKEFLMLQETINQMVDEIVGLKIQTYEKRIELQDMELKSIRLQLKPHFYLNALTTIASLSAQSKDEQIKIYIEALSKNIRYMFRAGFHTVPVKEEIKHVKNYFEMQELKYPGCIFYLIDLPKELEEWKIPQMLIHTFIENVYKHAISADNTLTMLIKISRSSYQGEDMLLIEMEDDGKGYPKDVLEYMEQDNGVHNEKGARIGLWSIRRMMELMYERQDLVLLENIKPHGCLSRVYVPERVVHELSEETIHTKL